VIGKAEMIRVLRAEHALSDRFIAYMLSRNIRIEEDLLDQLFDSAEKGLARALLLRARYGTKDKPDRILPNISPAALAKMVGTTPERLSGILEKFTRLGFIEEGLPAWRSAPPVERRAPRLRGRDRLDSFGLRRLDDLGHLPGGHFQLRRDDVLVPRRDARRAAFHQLGGAKRGNHDKLERIRSIGPGNHVNLLAGMTGRRVASGPIAQTRLRRVRPGTALMRLGAPENNAGAYRQSSGKQSTSSIQAPGPAVGSIRPHPSASAAR